MNFYFIVLLSLKALMMSSIHSRFLLLNLLALFDISPLSLPLKAAPSRGAWSGVPVVSPVPASACGPMEIEALPRSPGGEKRRWVGQLSFSLWALLSS